MSGSDYLRVSLYVYKESGSPMGDEDNKFITDMFINQLVDAGYLCAGGFTPVSEYELKNDDELNDWDSSIQDMIKERLDSQKEVYGMIVQQEIQELRETYQIIRMKSETLGFFTTDIYDAKKDTWEKYSPSLPIENGHLPECSRIFEDFDAGKHYIESASQDPQESL